MNEGQIQHQNEEFEKITAQLRDMQHYFYTDLGIFLYFTLFFFEFIVLYLNFMCFCCEATRGSSDTDYKLKYKKRLFEC
ncbi:MAG: hypothetical protein BV458_00255 [Thermoplasmata archaeon M9B2D]|nr:MAG: hypothetical protein BV458_00255 [Thermoplasmata archaeon M9B2D]